MPQKTIEDFRKEIDVCDAVIADMLGKRLSIVKSLAESGLKNVVRDPGREQQVIRNAMKAAGHEFGSIVAEIYKEIIKQSIRIQK